MISLISQQERLDLEAPNISLPALMATHARLQMYGQWE